MALRHGGILNCKLHWPCPAYWTVRQVVSTLQSWVWNCQGLPLLTPDIHTLIYHYPPPPSPPQRWPSLPPPTPHQFIASLLQPCMIFGAHQMYVSIHTLPLPSPHTLTVTPHPHPHPMTRGVVTTVGMLSAINQVKRSWSALHRVLWYDLYDQPVLNGAQSRNSP